MFEFDSDAEESSIVAWANDLLPNLPPGAQMTIERPPLVLGVDELTPLHKGKAIKVNRGKDSIIGTFDAVYGTVGGSYGKVVIVDGKAYEVNAFEVVTLS